MNKVKIKGTEYPLELKKSKRNKRMLFRFYNGSFHVSAPYNTTDADLSKTIVRLEDNLFKLIVKAENKEIKFDNFKYINFWGEKYLIYYSNKNSLEGNVMYLNKDDPKNGYLALSKKYALSYLTPRVNYYMKLIAPNVKLNGLKVRNMSSVYGNCYTNRKEITLNIKLAYFSVEQIDTVIIHEIVHLIHPDHSNEFYKTVLKYCPNYYELQKEMNGVNLR